MNPESLGGALALLAIIVGAIHYKRQEPLDAPDRSVHRGPGRSWPDHQDYIRRVTAHETRRGSSNS